MRCFCHHPYGLLCVVLLLVFLVHQCFLLVIALHAAAIGFDSDSALVRINPNYTFDQNASRKNGSQITIIHQIWRNKDTGGYGPRYRTWRWKNLCKASAYHDARSPLQYKLWTDEDVDALLAEARYAFIAPLYHALPRNVQRADVARMLVLHAHGGIYADLDTFPKEGASLLPQLLGPPFESDKLHSNATNRLSTFPPHEGSNTSASRDSVFGGSPSLFECALPLAWGGTGVSNHWMACRKGSPLLSFALHLLVYRYGAGDWWRYSLRRLLILPYVDVLASTGPIFLSDALRLYASSASSVGLTLTGYPPLAIALLSWPLISHVAGRSWHSADGTVINAVGDAAGAYAFAGPTLLITGSVMIGVLARYWWHGGVRR